MGVEMEKDAGVQKTAVIDDINIQISGCQEHLGQLLNEQLDALFKELDAQIAVIWE